MRKRVVVTGFGAISPLGNDWESVSAKLKSCTNAVQVMQEWSDIKGLHTRLGCPAAPFELDPVKYNRKSTRSMGRWDFWAFAPRKWHWQMRDFWTIRRF